MDSMVKSNLAPFMIFKILSYDSNVTKKFINFTD